MKGIRLGLNSGTTQHLPGGTEEKVITVVEVFWPRFKSGTPPEYKSKALPLGPTCWVDKHKSLLQKC